MKKITSLILTLLLVFAASGAAFAGEGAVPKDVQGTKYEAAVKALMEKEIVSGYPDGTFLPENPIDRAEACVIVVKAMNPKGADLFAAKNGAFTDMAGYEWAEKYVDYAVEKGVVSGYGDHTFKPNSGVTYGEMAAMLVNALGFSAKELPGAWPENYMNKAVELGIFKDVTADGKADVKAIRGDVALMTAAVADQIAAAANPKPQENPGGTQTPGTTEKPGGSDASNVPEKPVDNGKLADYSGRAYGVILDNSTVLDKDGYSVDQIKFLMGNQVYYLNTDGKASVPPASQYLKGNLYCLKMSGGIVKKISTDPKELGAARFEEFTGGFKEVAERQNTEIKTTDGLVVNIMDDAIIYLVDFSGSEADGYEAGRLSDIEKGDKLRAFDVTDDKNDLADIVIVVKASDAKNL